MSRWVVFGVALFVLFSLQCGSSEEGLPGEAPFNTAIEEVMPSFEVVQGLGRLDIGNSPRFQQTDWDSGNILYEIFYLLRDFNPDTDQGVIDTSNLYKTMWESRGFFANTKTQCQTITDKVIAPPFDFGNEATSYGCAFNDGDFGGAYKETDAKYGLFGFLWNDGTHSEYGTLQGNFNEASNDLSLDIAVWVDYATENDYCYRNDIDGNADTHLFTFRSIKGNNVPDNFFLSLVGKGYSQGSGKYFLLKATTSGSSNRYYCIGADDGEEELRAMDASGSEAVDANCAEFQSDVDALTLFTTGDLACESSDFNPGGTGEAAEGTVLLDF